MEGGRERVGEDNKNRQLSSTLLELSRLLCGQGFWARPRLAVHLKGTLPISGTELTLK